MFRVESQGLFGDYTFLFAALCGDCLNSTNVIPLWSRTAISATESSERSERETNFTLIHGSPKSEI